MLNDDAIAGSSAEPDLDRCRSWLAYQLNHPKRPSARGVWPPPGPAITISDQVGSGVQEIARHLTGILQASEPKDSAPWTVFHRLLLTQVLEEHHLPKSLAKLMSEDRRSYLDDVLDELIGLRPPSWELIPKVVQTVLHLANAGHVILVGRGASVIARQMSNVFHVRLIASLPRRIERVQELENLSPKEAAKFITRTERGRERYVRAYFHSRLNDDLQYHLVINSDRIPAPEAAELIAVGARRCFRNGPEAHDSGLAQGEQDSGVPATETDLAGFMA
jgi:cytidylate kinase